MLYLILAFWMFGACCMFLDTYRIAYVLSKDIALAQPILRAILNGELATESPKCSDGCIRHIQNEILSTKAWFIRVLPCSTAMLKVWPLTLFSLVFGQQIYESRVRDLLVASTFLEMVHTFRTLPKEKAEALICQVATLFELSTRVSLVRVLETTISPKAATEAEDA